MVERQAYIYRITNLLDGKNYIGVTVDPKKRFINHCRKTHATNLPLKNAIRKYGKEYFRMKILYTASQEECYAKEPVYIVAYNSLMPNGYNLSRGGRGSLGLVGEVNGCYGRTGEKHPNYAKPGYFKGRKHSEETKAKMRAARLGRKHSEAVKAKIGEASKRNFSEPGFIERMQKSGFCVGRPRKVDL